MSLQKSTAQPAKWDMIAFMEDLVFDIVRSFLQGDEGATFQQFDVRWRFQCLCEALDSSCKR